ncbi:MAG TPA: class E sortase, partial [Streptosporangiaceae bacterium]
MTQTISTGPAAGPAGRPAAPVPPPTTQQQDLRGLGVGLILLGTFLLGFLVYLYGLSAIQEARTQSTAYATLRGQLGELNQAVAPLGATTPGAPVALLNIPAIGVRHMVVVEGTTPENLELGPGHVRSTPLPGQTGISEIFGRRATFGAPFGRLLQLRRGDKLTVITGQGTAKYTIVAFGDSRRLVEDPAPNRLLLFTSCSAVVPTSYCYADADLTSAAQPDPGGRPAITSAETPLSGDSGALVLSMIWGLALAIISVAGTVAAARWSPR